MKKLLVLLMLLAVPVFAVEPDEILEDPVLEDRAREISKGLRCPVCQNESIDESDAQVAGDLRVLVRERLLAGDTNQETVDYIVDRYGEFVLLRPGLGGANLALWALGPVVLILSVGGVLWSRRRKSTGTERPLSAEEERRLAELLKD